MSKRILNRVTGYLFFNSNSFLNPQGQFTCPHGHSDCLFILFKGKTMPINDDRLKKDNDILICKPNKLLEDFYARVALYEMPECILSFYENNQDKIKGDVVIVRSDCDESLAAERRNNSDKVLFVFSEDYWVTSYFSSVCQKIDIPNKLIKRVRNRSN